MQRGMLKGMYTESLYIESMSHMTGTETEDLAGQEAQERQHSSFNVIGNRRRREEPVRCGSRSCRAMPEQSARRICSRRFDASPSSADPPLSL